MKTQFKKGVLEMLILLIVSKKDIYGYELVNTINTITEVKEGTVYPILKRLTNEHYFETYSQESSEGPTRKYYKITNKGLNYSHELLNEYKHFNANINLYLKGFGLDEE